MAPQRMTDEEIEQLALECEACPLNETTRPLDVAWQHIHRLVDELRQTRTERDEVRTIIEGRTVAPTAEEIREHATGHPYAGAEGTGQWLVAADGSSHVLTIGRDAEGVFAGHLALGWQRLPKGDGATRPLVADRLRGPPLRVARRAREVDPVSNAPFRDPALPPMAPSGPRAERVLRPLPLALSGTAGGAAVALAGAVVEHLATWTHGTAVGAVAGTVAFAATCVAARARHLAANPPPPPPPRRELTAEQAILQALVETVADARGEYDAAVNAYGGGSHSAGEAFKRLCAAEERLAEAARAPSGAPERP